jgi:hypothetical protein
MDFSWIELYMHLVIAALILLAPGVALYLGLLQLGRERTGPRRTHALIFGLGLSVAVWPLLLLYLSSIGLRFTALLLWAVVILSTAYAVYRIVVERPATLFTPGSIATLVSLGGMIALALFYRLGDVQNLPFPMFGDSLHHTLIATLIFNVGQVPQGYQPYVPVETFTYHFGFHTLAAIYAQVAAVSVSESVLFFGQVLNVATIPLAYAFNRWLFNSRLAGLGAALLTGFVSIMPAFYVNWGRYTQLAGHILLIPALIFLIRIMSPSRRRIDIALCAVCVAGLVVVHYRVLIFFGLFAVALAIWQLLSGWRDIRALLPSWSRGLLAIMLGFVATIPWLVNLALNYFEGLTRRLGSVTPDYLQEYNNPGTIVKYVGQLLPALALLGLGIGVGYLAMSRRGTSANLETAQGRWLPPHAACIVLVLWTALIIGSLFWPAPGALGSLTVAITLYIPLAALGGYGVGWLCERARSLLKISPVVFAPVLLGLAPLLAQLLGTSHVAAPGNWSYVQPADQQAFNWIRSNIPRSGRFLISSQFSYTGRAVTASDGGMWLPLLTGNNVIPPALSAWMEKPTVPTFFTDTRKLAGYAQPIGGPQQTDPSTQTNLLSRGTIAEVRPLTDPEALKLMRVMGITHIYSGADGGASSPRLDVAALRRDSQHFNLVYSRDGVYVFEVRY